MSENYLSELPVELKIEIYQRCSYVEKLVYYLYLVKYDSIDLRYMNLIKSSLYRLITQRELKTLVKYNNIDLLDLVIGMEPIVPYFDSYIPRMDIDPQQKKRKNKNSNISIDTLIKINLWASRYGCLNVLKRYIQVTSQLSLHDQSLMCRTAISKNQIECLNYIRSKNIEWDSTIFWGACEANNLELFKFFHESNLGIKEHLYIDELLQDESLRDELLKDKRMVNTCYILKDIKNLYSIISKHCNIEFLEYLHNIKPIKEGRYLTPSLKNGSKIVIEWGISRLIPLSPNHCYKAAAKGNLELLKWLRSVGCPWDEKVLISACKGGNIELFEYILEEFISNGYAIAFDYRYMEAAARGNHLEMVEYLHKNGYDYSPMVIMYGCKYKNYNMVKFVIDNKFQDNNTYTGHLYSLRGDVSIEFAELIINSGCSITESFISSCYTYGDLEVLKFIQKRRSITNNDLVAAAKNCQYHIISMAVEHGMEIPNTVVDVIISSDNIAMFKWCLNHGYVPVLSNLIMAISYDKLEFFKMMIHIYSNENSDINFGLLYEGPINIIKYLYQHKMLSYNLDLYTTFNTKPEMIEWLRSVEYPEIHMIGNKSLIGQFFTSGINYLNISINK